MNARDVLTYGHLTLLGSIDGLTPDNAAVPGACGVWSIKQLVAHLATYEAVFADVLAADLGAVTTPRLDRFLELGERFNDITVAERDGLTFDQTIAEYTSCYEDAMASLDRIAPERLREPGTLPWYGLEYSLDDLIVYQQYGHKREHAGQIGVFRGNMGF
jgi:DinB family protein